ncbi:hypothetical protein DFQ27_004059 [Actinomortierella ambigua]|uniref:F-box domain-containing protein n=1 Tax=Actinomortierella ambigua TaxID=1343610 RepID=A0A9P6Q2X1_9FUNG|nr:hypothetical protein DFQ27_004059 [Actinomortierella ambigua]
MEICETQSIPMDLQSIHTPFTPPQYHPSSLVAQQSILLPPSPAFALSPFALKASRPRSGMPLPHLPENIWLDIFQCLSLEEKIQASRTCRTWHRILADPSLYTHICLDGMEFNKLVGAMRYLVQVAPRLRSLRISRCYSTFIATTTVPVHNSAAAALSPYPHFHFQTMHSHISSLTLSRRQEEYQRRGFTLHHQFSVALSQVMEQSQATLQRLEVEGNFLDLEMTSLISSIVCFGHHLETLVYDQNKDEGLVTPEVVSAIMAACPRIQTLGGRHAISDEVLGLMANGWQELRSVTLAPYPAAAVTNPKEASIDALWSLLEKGRIEQLELVDLNCVSNENLATLAERAEHLRTQLARQQYYHHSHDHSRATTTTATTATITGSFLATALEQQGAASAGSMIVPGESVRHLSISKYTSSALTLPGFVSLLKLFPRLQSLSFQTNFVTYDLQFQGLTHGIYEAEIAMVERLVRNEMTQRWGASAGDCWRVDWDAPMTDEQRLRHAILNPVCITLKNSCEIFICEITRRAWLHAEDNKRRTLQRSDVANAVSKSDQFDFLIDIVPREEPMKTKARASREEQPAADVYADQYTHYYSQGAGGLTGYPHFYQPVSQEQFQQYIQYQQAAAAQSYQAHPSAHQPGSSRGGSAGYQEAGSRQG